MFASRCACDRVVVGRRHPLCPKNCWQLFMTLVSLLSKDNVQGGCDIVQESATEGGSTVAAGIVEATVEVGTLRM